MPILTDYVKWFRGASSYVNVHRGRTFVIMLGGDAIADDNFANIVQDVAVLSSLGVRLVLVHGARPQIDQALRGAGLESHYHLGVRITSDRAIEVVRDTVSGLGAKLASAFSSALRQPHGERIRTAQSNPVVAKPLGVVNGVDYGFTGDVRRIDAGSINVLLKSGYLVIVPCLGYSPSGEIFNLRCELVAAEVARAIRAQKLIVMHGDGGVRNASGEIATELRPGELDDIIAALEPGDETAARLTALASAARAGVPRGHLLSFAQDGALLLELFTREGIGTQISNDGYETLRSANIDDVPGIIELIHPLEERGVLVRRSREHLEQEFDHFWVAELDGMVIGCAALYPFDDSRAGELACLVTHPDFRDRQPHDAWGSRPQTVGELLLARVERSAADRGLDRIFVLTTQTAHWFIERGFHETDLSVLPAKKQALYNLQRNSKMLVKELNPDHS
jgi:amino-acid N-acetyltransferase